MEDLLRLEYVPLSVAMMWEDNKKLHDIGGIIQSIRRHGFKDPAKFEPALNGGNGGIVEGNGRFEALASMRESGADAPRGVAVTEDGAWAVPVLFGVDAESEEAAEAYGIDHNQLTMMGGDFSLSDTLHMWESDFEDQLRKLAEADAMPVTIDGDDLDALIAYGDADVLPPDEFPEYGDDIDVDYRCPKCGYEWSGSAK